jgi:hypothetical protein
MTIAQIMFRTGDKSDFERMLNAMLLRAKTDALHITAQVLETGSVATSLHPHFQRTIKNPDLGRGLVLIARCI